MRIKIIEPEIPFLNVEETVFFSERALFGWFLWFGRFVVVLCAAGNQDCQGRNNQVIESFHDIVCL
jgi:hypothetical protein